MTSADFRRYLKDIVDLHGGVNKLAKMLNVRERMIETCIAGSPAAPLLLKRLGFACGKLGSYEPVFIPEFKCEMIVPDDQLDEATRHIIDEQRQEIRRLKMELAKKDVEIEGLKHRPAGPWKTWQEIDAELRADFAEIRKVYVSAL